MRVLIVSNLLPPRIRGGYELACYNLARGLIARGHDVRILTTDTELIPSEPQPFVDRGLQIRRFQDIPVTNPVLEALFQHESMVSLRHNTVYLLQTLREFRPDHVLAFNLLGIGGIALLDLLNTVGAPWTFNMGDRVPSVLLDGMSDDMRAIFGAVGGEVFHSGQIAAISQSVVDETIGAGIHLGDRVEIISRGVIPHGRTHERPYRDGGTTRFVFASTVGREKGMDIVLDAVRLLVDDERERDFAVDVYGSGIVEYYEQKSLAMGLGAHVRFHGPIPQVELIGVHARSDAFLFPTWTREALGSAPLEAASVGCVPIITASCGAAERLADGVHCIKIERNARDLASAMRRVADGDVDLETLGAAGQKLALGDLSFARSVDLLEAFITAGNRPGWRDGRLDDPGVGEHVVALDNAATRLFYDTLAARRAAATRRPRSRQRIGA